MKTTTMDCDARASEVKSSAPGEARPKRRLTADTVRAVRGGYAVRTGLRAGAMKRVLFGAAG